MSRPNIIQIVVDDMGYGDLSSINYGASSTPVLDQLASEGACLSQHYSASPVCAPARAALLTGSYPQRYGVIDTLEAFGTDRLALRAQTIATHLAGVGYATGLVGKWHSGAFDDRYHPRSRGFDEFLGFRGGWQDYWSWSLERDGSTLAADGRYLTDVLSEGALDFVRRHRDQPFFLHLAYNAPHYPFQAPAGDIDDFMAPGRSRRVATIYAMIRRVDQGIGRILQLLSDLGIEENTLVCFVSDNGPQLDGHGDESADRFNAGLRGAKQTVWEGGIRVPGMLRWGAQIAPRTSIDAVVHFTDWMPTLLEAAGLDPRIQGDGSSVLPLLRGDVDPSFGGPRFWQWTRYEPIPTSNAAMRDGDWKLVWPSWPGSLDASFQDDALDREVKTRTDMWDRLPYPAPGNTTSAPAVHAPVLINIRDDPEEQHNLADANPKRVTAMSGALERWFEDVERDRHDGRMVAIATDGAGGGGRS